MFGGKENAYKSNLLSNKLLEAHGNSFCWDAGSIERSTSSICGSRAEGVAITD